MWRPRPWFGLDPETFALGLAATTLGAIPLLSVEPDSSAAVSDPTSTARRRERRRIRRQESSGRVYTHEPDEETRVADLSWNLAATIPALTLTGVETSAPGEPRPRYEPFTSADCKLFVQAVQMVFELDKSRRAVSGGGGRAGNPKPFVPLHPDGPTHGLNGHQSLTDEPMRRGGRWFWQWIVGDAWLSRPDQLCMEIIVAFQRLAEGCGHNLRIRLVLDERELIMFGMA